MSTTPSGPALTFLGGAQTVTGSKTLLDTHYGDRPALARALAEVMAEQVREIDADIVQFDEANITGAPDEAGCRPIDRREQTARKK